MQILKLGVFEEVQKCEVLTAIRQAETTNFKSAGDDQLVHSEKQAIRHEHMKITEKSAQQIRNAYLSKLLSMGMLRHEPSKQVQTIIIFDWDDTLLCTSYLGAFGSEDLPSIVIMALEELDKQVVRVLKKASQYGSVFVVTNAVKSWVEKSSKLYMPRTAKILFPQEKIPIISAREDHSQSYPGDNLRWKVQAFRRIGNNFRFELTTNIISIGDSVVESESATRLCHIFNDTRLKIVKLRENPTVQELTKQLQLVETSLEKIHKSVKDLKVHLEKRKDD